MKFTPTGIEGVLLIEPRVFEDSRGFFYESYRKEEFAKNGIRDEFVQDNRSRSRKGVLRGLHFQIAPCAQAKLVSITRGSAYDVAVDIRPGSRTYGVFFGEILSAQNKKMIYVPAGLAHGFLSLEDDTEMLYKVSVPYSPAHEKGIIWNDSRIAVSWPKLDVEYVISEKDKKFSCLQDIEQ